MSESQIPVRPFHPSRALRIAILGAGPGGLCMAIRLKQAGFRDIVILEKADGVGGTWYHNRYPGCACDIQSHLYSFSFEPRNHWSKPYAPQAEILDYMEQLAAKYELLPHCRFGNCVKSARWSEREACWTLELESGPTLEAEVVVSAIGMFNDLVWPDLEGVGSFAGTTFHSARWNWDHDLSGKTVAVVGSAASAVQFVPEIVKQAKQVHLFQRTANWVLPKLDAPYTQEQLAEFRNDPKILLALRQQIFDQVDGGLTFSNPKAVAELEGYVLMAMEVVEDPEVRDKLRPQHPFGCKRPLLSNAYYAAFNRPNLELVTEGIARITPDGIATVDGEERRVDTLIYATGFETTQYASAIDFRGRGGEPIADAWKKEGAAAYLGITTAGFPNLFMLYGPNTNNGSLLTMLESQVEYTLQLVRRLVNEDLAWLDVRKEVMARYNAGVDELMGQVKAWQAGCNGYYRSPSGRIVTQWPASMTEYRDRTAKPDDDAFEVGRRQAG